MLCFSHSSSILFFWCVFVNNRNYSAFPSKNLNFLKVGFQENSDMRRQFEGKIGIIDCFCDVRFSRLFVCFWTMSFGLGWWDVWLNKLATKGGGNKHGIDSVRQWFLKKSWNSAANKHRTVVESVGTSNRGWDCTASTVASWIGWVCQQLFNRLINEQLWSSRSCERGYGGGLTVVESWIEQEYEETGSFEMFFFPCEIFTVL